MLRRWQTSCCKPACCMNKRAAALFPELLSAAIWNRPANEQLFRNIDLSVWQEIIQFAESHKVSALLYDGVLKLPEAVRPEKKMVYTLFFHADATEKLYLRNTQALRELSMEFDKMEIPFVLLKGHGNAVCYPNPRRRSPGDIDLFFYEDGDYRRANDWAKAQGFKMHSEHIHHQSFVYHKVYVENHRQVSYFEMRRYDRLLDAEVQKIIENNGFQYTEIEGVKVRTLPPEFNLFFVFQHLFHHFIHLGVGMKQFCDWILCWNRYYSLVDKKEFNRLAEAFDLLDAMKVFASVAVKYLGADPAIFPFETDVNGKYVNVVMDDVLNGGNFGFSVFKNQSFRNELHRKLYSFVYTTGRIRKIVGIAPKHIKPLPFVKLNKNIKLLFKK